MGWIVVNAILCAVMFAAILGVMALGHRWQRETHRAEAAADRRRRELAARLESGADWDAEMGALVRETVVGAS